MGVVEGGKDDAVPRAAPAADITATTAVASDASAASLPEATTAVASDTTTASAPEASPAVASDAMAATAPAAATGAMSFAQVARQSTKDTSAEESAYVVLNRARAAKAASARLRYKLQMEQTRKNQEEAQRAREKAQADEARRLAEKEAAAEAERQRRLDEAARREAERKAEAGRREAELAEEAARVTAALDADLRKHEETAKEFRRAEAEALQRKAAERDAKISRAKAHKQSALAEKWKLGEQLRRGYEEKVSAHERAVKAFVEAHHKARTERSSKHALGSTDVLAETAKKMEAVLSRLSTAEQRANQLKAEREKAAADAAAGKSDYERARREKLAAAERAFAQKLDKRLGAQEAAERRRLAAEAAAAKELADARARADQRAAEVAERAEAKARELEERKAQAVARIAAEDAKRAEQLRLTAQLAIDRQKAATEELRNGQARASLRTPGPTDVDNRFFAIGRRTIATTGSKHKRNGPAFTIGTRTQVLAAPPSAGPGPNKYLPSYSQKQAAPTYSFGRRFSMAPARDAAETPGPLDYAPSKDSLERTKMRRAPAAIFDSPIDGKLRHNRQREAQISALDFAEARLPGPGDYNITGWRTDSSPSFSFGGQGVRNRRDVAKRADISPGPASYGYPSLKMISKGLSF